MNKKQQTGFCNKFESRMDDFFKKNEVFDDEEEYADYWNTSPLRWLKTIVLSIDWEITDDGLNKFIEQVNKLQSTDYKTDKIILMFLKLLDSLGKYIKDKKATAHPDAIKLLILSYKSLEEIILTKSMTAVEKKIILSARARDFAELKTKMLQKDKWTKPQAANREISEIKKEAPKNTEIKKAAIKKEMPEQTQNNAHLLFDKAVLDSLNDIKQIIKDEFKSLRDVLIRSGRGTK